MSRMDALGYAANYVMLCGVHPQSGVAKEITHIVMSLFLGACVDGLDLTTSAVAEHWARRLLQLQKAIKRNADKPNYTGLDYYMAHCSPASEGIPAPLVDAEIAAHAKTDATILRELRLQAHEKEEEKKPPATGGRKRGKNGKTAEGADDE